MTKSPARRFSGTPRRAGKGLRLVVIDVPFDAAKLWGKRGQIRVQGEMNGFAFRTTLRPTGTGKHFMLLNRKIQAGAGVTTGVRTSILLQPDLAQRKVTIPRELERFFKEERALGRWFATQLNLSTRGGISAWVAEPKTAASRERRAEQIAERLLSIMEAERELPPAIQRALAANAKAYRGWESMSATLRRRHLMTIFYYRDPAAQGGAIAKMVEEAAARADRMEENAGEEPAEG